MRNPGSGAGARDHAGGDDHGEHTAPDTDKQGEKRTFAPLPARAIGDANLTGLHLKVLGAIAMHDRLGKNRQGCWAGNKRLAEMVGCDYSRLSATLTHLATLGYIERDPHPLNKRLRVLRVLYTDNDKAMMKGADTLPNGKQSVPAEDADSLPDGKAAAETVCRDFQEAPQFQEDESVEYIPQKRGRDFAEAREENSAEAAPCGAPAMKEGQRYDVVPTHARELQDTGMYLRKVEEAFKTTSGRPFTRGEVDYFRHHAEHCAQLEDRWLSLGGSEEEERIGYWAQRLAVEITDKMTEAA